MSNETLTVMVLYLFIDKKEKSAFDKIAIGCMGILATIDIIQYTQNLLA